ncbi:helix-turn-helix transcriptional regulator [Maliponia aquimaris]|uniref:Helix-turn-helix domain-containing protein n=1 Tax=Maliponia aquimaris TaxID=1673631 RepID=A0A238K3D7_9RHOB|nr:helix-turn-helix domain-containing protein [Maliponia aquimaris]SMX37441.1 hypothetical protein MAA8898_01145 [Maliponia aquimaris]
MKNDLEDTASAKFLIEPELAKRWKKTRRTIQRMRSNGSGPAYHRIGGSILYKIEDVEAYEAAARVPGVKS